MAAARFPRKTSTSGRFWKKSAPATKLPGLPASQKDVGNWEDYPEEHRPDNWDTDGDGMPDAWEREQRLDPTAAQDGNANGNGDGYTNLKECLGVVCGGVWQDGISCGTIQGIGGKSNGDVRMFHSESS
jgi:hypothetical protein